LDTAPESIKGRRVLVVEDGFHAHSQSPYRLYRKQEAAAQQGDEAMTK
jgi:hypothetical protein